MQPKGIDLDAAGNINGLPVIEVDLDSFEDKPWRKPGGASRFLVVNIFCSCLLNFTCTSCPFIAASVGGCLKNLFCSASDVCLYNWLCLLTDQTMLLPKVGLHLLYLYNFPKENAF